MRRALKSSVKNGYINITAFQSVEAIPQWEKKGELAKQCFLDCLEASEAAVLACVLHAERFEKDLVGFTSLQLITLTSLVKMWKVNSEHAFSQNTMPMF